MGEEQSAPPPPYGYEGPSWPIRNPAARPRLRHVPRSRAPIVQEHNDDNNDAIDDEDEDDEDEDDDDDDEDNEDDEEEDDDEDNNDEDNDEEEDQIDELVALRIRAAEDYREFRAHLGMAYRANEDLRNRLHWQSRDYAALWDQYLRLQRDNVALRARQRARDQAAERMVARARAEGREAREARIVRDQCVVENRALRERNRVLEQVLRARVELQARMCGGGGGDQPGLDTISRMASTQPAEFRERARNLLHEERGFTLEDQPGASDQGSKEEKGEEEGKLAVPEAIAQARQGQADPTTQPGPHSNNNNNNNTAEQLQSADVDDPLGESFSRLIGHQAALSRQLLRTDIASTTTTTTTSTTTRDPQPPRSSSEQAQGQQAQQGPSQGQPSSMR